jgi:hypothetical protein
MKTKLIILIIALCLSTGFALGDITNTRPFGSSTYLASDTTPGIDSLQEIFQSIGSTIDVIVDQNPAAIFVPEAGSISHATYIATITWNYPGIEFGIYEYGNETNTLKLFDGTGGLPSAGANVTIDFDYGAGTVSAYNGSGYYESASLMSSFGFYAYRVDKDAQGVAYYDGGPFYSEDSLNDGSVGTNARFLTYEGKGDNVTIPNRLPGDDAGHWYIASEVGNYEQSPYNDNTSTGDFSDFLVLMESIKPVPVPGAILLGILGLSAAGLKLRKYA